MLKPLEQFICDFCGNTIESIDDAYVEWESKLLYDPHREVSWGFKIVHHMPASPNADNDKFDGCYHYTNSNHRSDTDLRSLMGNNQMIELLGLLDVGPRHLPEYSLGVKDVREYVEFVRRLTIPYYEEARQYFETAISDGFFGDYNELRMYQPDILQSLIKEYNSR